MRVKTSVTQAQDRLSLRLIGAGGVTVDVVDDATGGEAEATFRLAQSPGNTYFVDTDNGLAANTGSSWNDAFLTMDAAFDVLASGDTIYFRGKVREQLTAPALVFDVSIIGASNRPRHADTHAGGAGGESGATWALPASGSTNNPLLTVVHQGWRLSNFVMAGHATNACVLLLRDGTPDAADEQDPSHFEAIGVRFASGKNGIEASGGPYNVGIYGCSFHDLTDYAIKHTAGAGIAAAYRWQIKGNRFQGNAKWIDTFNCNSWEITDNVVVKTTTPGFDTSGGTGGNAIVRNVFDIAAASFDPAGGFTGHATDVWSNYLTDAIETGLPAN